MKKLSLIASMFMAALAMNSCDNLGVDTPVVPEAGNKTVRLEATMAGYTRATDTSFEEGDRIGLYVFTPDVYIDNAEFTYTKGALKAETEYKWYEDETMTSTLVGYYPYQPEMVITGDGSYAVNFTINADQSTHELYTASDLMIATVATKPTAEAVALPFRHVLSKIVITVDNKTDETITGVYMAGVLGTVVINPVDGQFYTDGKQGTIKASSVTDNTGASKWVLITVPQHTSPTLILTTADKQYSYTLDEGVELQSGKQHAATITLNKGSISTEFTSEITDWTPDNDLNFKQEWNTIGTGMYVDDVLASLFAVNPIEYEVTIQENRIPGRYRILNPYGEGYPEGDILGEGEIIINATNPEMVYMENSYIGTMNNDYGDFYAGSLCPENGLGNFTRYGTLVDGVIRFPLNGLYLKMTGYSNGALLQAAIHSFSIVTLPGYTRTKEFYGFDDLTYDGAATDNSGASVANFTVSNRLDNPFVKIAILDGVLYNNDIQAKVDAMVADTIASEDTGISGHGTFSVAVPIATSGTYTAIVYTVDHEGNSWWHSKQFGYVAAGSETPANNLTMSEPVVSTINPEHQISFNVKCPDVLNAYVAAVKTSALTEAAVTEEQYASFAVENGTAYTSQSVRTNIDSETGYDITLTNLEPATEYTVIVFAETMYGVGATKWATVTTSAAPEWVKLNGTGMFYDNLQINSKPEKYSAEVEIYQEASGKEKYRVMAPYAPYWKTVTDSTYYWGPSGDHLEFWVEAKDGVDYVHFKPCSTGFKQLGLSDEGNELIATEWSLNRTIYSRYNKRVSEGVYQLDPWYEIVGTNYGYNGSCDEMVIITLPGYSYEFTTTESSSAPAKVAPAQQGGIKVIDKVGKFNRNRSIRLGKVSSTRTAATATMQLGTELKPIE